MITTIYYAIKQTKSKIEKGGVGKGWVWISRVQDMSLLMWVQTDR